VLVGRASVLVGRASVLVGRASVPVYRSHPGIRRRRISGIQTKTVKPGCFMHWCHETTKMGVPPGNRPAVPRCWSRGVPKWYVARADTRGRTEGRPYPWS